MVIEEFDYNLEILKVRCGFELDFIHAMNEIVQVARQADLYRNGRKGPEASGRKGRKVYFLMNATRFEKQCNTCALCATFASVAILYFTLQKLALRTLL